MQSKTNRLILFFLVVSVITFITCEKEQEPTPFIAKVGSHFVSVDEFVSSYKKVIGFSNKVDSPAIRKLHVDKLVEKKLLAVAAREKGLPFDDNISQQISLEKERILKDLLFEKEIASQKITLNDSILRTHFRWKNTEVYLRHLYHMDYQTVDSIAKIVQQDTAAFIQEAVKLFQNQELKESGGLLGWVPYNILDPQLEESAFSMPVGVISNPVQSSFGWHLVLKQNERYNPIISEDKFLMESRKLEYNIYRKKYQILADQYVSEMIQNSKIVIHDSLFYLVSTLMEKLLSDNDNTTISEKETSGLELIDLAEEELAILNGDSFTVDDFVVRLQTQPPNVVNGNLKTGLYRIIRDQILLQKANELGIEDDPTVDAQVRDVEDNYYASLYLQSVLPPDSTHIASSEMKRITDSLSGIYPIEYNQALLDTFLQFLNAYDK